MATLQEMLTPVAPQFVADCQALIDGEVDSKGGLSGTAVKAAYKVVTAFAPGYYSDTLRAITPDMVNALEPFWADFLVSGGADFGDYLVKNGEEVSEALLGVTDNMVRGSAGKNIEAALPNLGAMIQKYS